MIDPPNLAHDYRIVRVLGRGGMGVVYEAEHGSIGRRVALKVLSEGSEADPTALARLRREALAMGALQHPHVVQISDYVEGPPPFLVMELLSGQSLRQRLATRGPMPTRDACLVAVQLLSALGAAHRAGIVHRDVKPTNVFLVQTPLTNVFVKLLDFGLAKLTEAKAPALTSVDDILGSAPYMAPEQIRGEAVDGRTDLFALGIVLYEMLAGRRPFSPGPGESVMVAILRGAPPAPLAGVPEGLEAVVRRALEREPAARYASAEAMADALARFVPSSSGGASWAPDRDTTGVTQADGRLSGVPSASAGGERAAETPTRTSAPAARGAAEPARPPTAPPATAPHATAPSPAVILPPMTRFAPPAAPFALPASGLAPAALDRGLAPAALDRGLTPAALDRGLAPAALDRASQKEKNMLLVAGVVFLLLLAVSLLSTGIRVVWRLVGAAAPAGPAVGPSPLGPPVRLGPPTVAIAGVIAMPEPYASEAEIRAVVRAHNADLVACAVEVLPSEPAFAGNVAMIIKVNGRGVVKEASCISTQAAPAGAPLFCACASSRILHWPYPPRAEIPLGEAGLAHTVSLVIAR